MINYKMIIYKMENEEGFDVIAEYPALKGVVGIGSNEIEAIENLFDSAASNLEALKEAGLPIPDEDAYVLDDYSGKLSLRLSKGLHRKVATVSSEQGVSINQFLVEAVTYYVGNQLTDQSLNQKIDDLITAATKLTTRKYTVSNQRIALINQYKPDQEIFLKGMGCRDEQFASWTKIILWRC